ncbi:MAG TPA: ABC transporter, partial [Alphaproteobacteria bacterium]|nr:ABC transporter [Alphaproteobacteria bacterium]
MLCRAAGSTTAHGPLSIAENLRLGAWSQRRRLDARALEERIERVCGRFPVLLERLHQPAGTLSGGQQ